MITVTLPAEDVERIADVLRNYALEDFADAQTEAENGNPELLRECAHINFLADLLHPKQTAL